MFVLVYLDDVLSTFEEHKLHLQAVLRRLETVGLKLNPKKCHFVRTHVHYLGHVITAEGVKPTTTHLQLRRMLKPILGLASFYRKFVPSYAKLPDPLHKLTCKNEAFMWSPACQEAFDCLKSY